MKWHFKLVDMVFCLSNLTLYVNEMAFHKNKIAFKSKDACHSLSINGLDIKRSESGKETP